MSADQEPVIADDGVQEAPLTIARRVLTRLIEQAREDGLVSALTIRGRRRAYLVTPDFYEQALHDAATLRGLRELAAAPTTGAKPDKEQQARVLRDALAAIES